MNTPTERHVYDLRPCTAEGALPAETLRQQLDSLCNRMDNEEVLLAATVFLRDQLQRIASAPSPDEQFPDKPAICSVLQNSEFRRIARLAIERVKL